MLTQQEADLLTAMEKLFCEPDPIMFPGPGEDIQRDLISSDGKERFVLDVGRGYVRVGKCTYQQRARFIFVLARVDLAGPTHTSPDGQVVPCPHIHLYREGYQDKWAYPLPADRFGSPDNVLQTLVDFIRYCNMINPPEVQGALVQ